MSNPTGIIKYGSGDPSIVHEDSLTNEATITANGGTLRTGSIVDSKKGIRTGSQGAATFDLTGLSLDTTTLSDSGQISIDVSADCIATPLSEDPGAGNTAGTAYFLHWNGTNNNTPPYGRVYQQGVGDVFVSQVYYHSSGNVDSITNKEEIHKALSEDGYITITVSWQGDTTRNYANGVLITTNSPRYPADNVWDYLGIGTLIGNTTSAVDAGHYFKNLVISDKPVSGASHPVLSNVAGIGDSFFANAHNGVSAAYGAEIQECLFGDFLRNYGFAVNIDLSEAVSGSTLDDTSGNQIESQLTPCLALHPRIVVVNGGVNDVLGDKVISDVTSGLQSIANTLLASGTNIDHVIFFNSPDPNSENGWDFSSNTIATGAAASAKTKLVNAEINAMPAWWDTNNPSDTGRVHVLDLYTAFGGEVADQVNYTTDNYHPSGTGYKKMADLAYKKILQLIG